MDPEIDTTLFSVVDIKVYARMCMHYVSPSVLAIIVRRPPKKDPGKDYCPCMPKPGMEKKMQDENRGSIEERGGEERGEEN